MPPQKRAAAKKPADKVEVDPPSAATPRSGPSKKAVAAAVEKSAEFLEAQNAAPTDVHPGPTTPSKAEVDAAVEQSAEFLEEQTGAPTDVHPGPTTPSQAQVQEAVEQSAELLKEQGVNVDAGGTAALPVSSGRDFSQDAAPVSSGGRTPGLDASPVAAGRDKSRDANPVYTAPPPTDRDD